jgi:hypothetical protein
MAVQPVPDRVPVHTVTGKTQERYRRRAMTIDAWAQHFLRVVPAKVREGPKMGYAIVGGGVSAGKWLWRQLV